VNFSYTVNDAELRATLAKLPTRLVANVRKRGIRKPLTKVRADLRALWRKAKFRGKPPHRKAISSATRIDIRRVRNNVIRGKVGVEYGRKGGARAKGMQRIYHLLESGFKHKSAAGIAKRISGRNISAGYVRANGKRIYQEISRAILVEARAALKGQTA